MNNVFKDVVSTREAAIDAEGFHLMSCIGKEQVESCVGDLVFDPVVFAEKLVSLSSVTVYDVMHVISMSVGDLYGWSSWWQQYSNS